ncbi:MAG TPA: bifunctional phosphopantothenoylcysteine decarboxylase/phosphopantothenate--cysteine ligase CoaBC, partial [Burkholderiaceae bacterium]|nr:bifunctional phosphopantothenoylcysteine decarboxylase/phosphopantothenate--cysteine ligase CoaBC [Burkholderiaceae bacterium]
ATLVLARDRARTPVLVAPAMNVEMWDNPATQRNIAQLRADGIVMLGPASGAQACGETGFGRMLEAHELLDDIIAFVQPKTLTGRKVLLTAGPTFEPIDPVRGITNLSSGKTGFAIARAARDAGGQVTLIAGPTALTTPRGVQRIDVTTAREMMSAVMRNLPADVFISVAAVADWHVSNQSASKIKKSAAAPPPALQFAPNPDILASVAGLPSAPYCVGFAAESDDVIDNARRKLASKKVPLIVANRAQDALGADSSELSLIDAHGVTTLPRADKLAQARLLIAEIASRLK